MKSKQVMLTLVALVMITGCSTLETYRQRGADPLISPYETRRVWAIAPLRNESGSMHVDVLALSDHLARQLEQASSIDVLPVNRTLAAMQALEMAQISTPADAMRLLRILGADAIVVGSVTAYDPYDPPKLGMALELHSNPKFEAQHDLNVRGLTGAAVDPGSLPSAADRTTNPVSVVSGFLDSAEPTTRRQLERYASDRGRVDEDQSVWGRVKSSPGDYGVVKRDTANTRFYRINMDLYSEFVAYVMSWRLLKVESDRLARATARSRANQDSTPLSTAATATQNSP